MSLDSFPRAEAQVTLSRLSHWEKRLEQECELLHHAAPRISLQVGDHVTDTE